MSDPTHTDTSRRIQRRRIQSVAGALIAFQRHGWSPRILLELLEANGRLSPAPRDADEVDATIRFYSDLLYPLPTIDLVDEAVEELADDITTRHTQFATCLDALRTTDAAITAVHKAFGAPGDHGYDTPYGEALFALYKSQARILAALAAAQQAAR